MSLGQAPKKPPYLQIFPTSACSSSHRHPVPRADTVRAARTTTETVCSRTGEPRDVRPSRGRQRHPIRRVDSPASSVTPTPHTARCCPATHSKRWPALQDVARSRGDRPADADMSGMPPTLIQVGSHELFLWTRSRWPTVSPTPVWRAICRSARSDGSFAAPCPAPADAQSAGRGRNLRIGGEHGGAEPVAQRQRVLEVEPTLADTVPDLLLRLADPVGDRIPVQM